jgi:hypothetical protein
MIFIFIFLEIIILNCFGLNKNIKKYIINRANEDYSIEEISDRSNSEEVINDNYVYSTNFEEENNVLSEMKNKGNNLEKC